MLVHDHPPCIAPAIYIRHSLIDRDLNSGECKCSDFATDFTGHVVGEME